MNAIAGFFSAYTLRARLQPAALTLLPLLSLIVLTPAAWEMLPLVSVVASFSGFTLLLTQFVRDAGRRIEIVLYQQWGGMPSTTLLRHRDTRLSPETKRRYHVKLASGLSSPMPSAAEESSDPVAADLKYASACDWLRAQSRGAGHEALFEENIAYGFRRNLLGVLPLTVFCACCAVSILALSQWYSWPVEIAPASRSYVAPLIIANALYAVAMMTTVKPNWVKRAADDYARRLLETSDRL